MGVSERGPAQASSNRGAAPGTLFVVGTPIGNLGDLSQRAAETLRSVHRVAAEDTRRTRALLSHLGIVGVPVLRLDAQVVDRSLPRVLALLRAGHPVAMVTDAGMPSVSDPGSRLVHAAAEAGVPVVVVPGPSAVTAAVAASGLVDGPFFFVGFLPRRGGKRVRVIERIAQTGEPVVLFEAPNRTRTTLQELAALMPDRAAVVCRELTTLHEEVARGRLSELAARQQWRGEVTIVLGPSRASADETATADANDRLETRIRELIAVGEPSKRIVAELARTTALPRRVIYAQVQRLRGRMAAERPG